MSTWADGLSAGRTAAELEASVRDYTDTEIQVRERLPYEALRAPSGSDDTSAIHAARDRLVAGGRGGRIILGPGSWQTATGFVFPGYTATPTPITIQGSGIESTTLTRTADVVTVDISASAADGIAYNATRGHELHDLTISGGSLGTTPALRTYYASRLAMERIRLSSCPNGIGWDAVQLWDSFFSKFRVQLCGKSDGTAPAVRFSCRTTDTSNAFGYSVDCCNQLTFDDLVLEGAWGGFEFARNSDGASGSTANNHSIKFNRMHAEGTTLAQPFIKSRGTFGLVVEDSMFYVGNLASGISALNMLDIGASGLNASAHVFRNIHTQGAGGASRWRTFLTLGSAGNVVLDNVWGTYQTGRAPTVALIEWTGTNTNVSRRNLFWNSNPDSAVLESGSPTSLAPSPPTTMLSGAGKTTVSDSDFATGTVFDGMRAFVTNTSDSTVREGIRVGGAWLMSAAYS